MTNGSKRVLQAAVIPLLIIMGAVLAISINYHIAKDREVKRAQRILTDSAREQVHRFNAKMEGKFSVVKMTAEYLSDHKGDITAERDILKDAEYVGGFRYAAVSWKTDPVARLGSGGRMELAQSDFYKKALEGVTSLGYIGSSHQDRGALFIYAAPIWRLGVVEGAVMGAYDADRLIPAIVSEAYDRRGYSFICGADGRVIIGSWAKSYLLGGGRRATGRVNLLSVLESRAKMAPGTPLESLKKKLRDGKSGSVAYTIAGKSRYAVFEPLYINDWFLFNVVDASIITAQAAQNLRGALFMGACVFVMAFFIALYMLRRERYNTKIIAGEREKLRVSEMEYRVAASHSTKAIVRFDIKARIAYTLGYNADTGASLEEFPGLPDSAIRAGIVAPESVDAFKGLYDLMAAGEPTGGCVVRMKNKDGAFAWVQYTYTLVSDDAGKPSCAIITSEDITERREREIAYQKWENTICAIPDEKMALFEFNLSRGGFERREGKLALFFAEDETANFSASAARFINELVCEEDRAACAEALNREKLIAAFHDGVRSFVADVRVADKEGGYKWRNLDIQTAALSGSLDIRVYLLFTDIDEEKRAHIEVARRAVEDSLTHLYNRGAFTEMIVRMTKDEGAPFAFVIIDIDGFKRVNDTLGHNAGDRLLVEAANRLCTMVRKEDIVCRLGGDEFIVCLKNIADDAGIEKKARELCGGLRISAHEEGVSVSVSASLGVALYPRDGRSFETLYKRADAALYHVKRGGKNHVGLYRPEMEDIARSVRTED
ncbi:MAG: diguanylate cyclase [Cloacibacillus sp.]